MQVATMHAFGHPGISSTRTSSAKDMIGCARGPARLWFTTGYGLLNEVYYPRADIAQIRGAGLPIYSSCEQKYSVIPQYSSLFSDVSHLYAQSLSSM